MTGGFHFKTYTLLFNQLVQPIIMSNACIWGHKDSLKVMGIQHRALRYFLGVGKMCPLAGLFGETGWIPLKALIKFNILKFWHRVVSMDADRLTRQIYIWSKSLADRGVINWAKHTSNILNSLHECNLLQQGHGVAELWDAIISQALQTWRSSVQETPKNSETGGRLILYRQIKSAPAPESYINSISTNKRRIITMLRCGCLPLEVETGRYRAPKTPLLQRTCEICGNGIGDETHFLNYCQPLTALRLQLYKAASDACDFNFYALSPEQKTLQMLNLCAKVCTVKDLIYDMFILRKSLLDC